MIKNSKSVLISISLNDHAFLLNKGYVLSKLGIQLFEKFVEEVKTKDILFEEHQKKREELLNAVQQEESELEPAE